MLRIIIACLLLCFSIYSSAQTVVNIEDMKNTFLVKSWYKLSGMINASTVYYAGNNANNNRSPFLWYINGNVNANLFGQIDLPFSFNITDGGTQYAYPTAPTRLSIAPKYKWITAYIGDASMVFSPYTLNGHLFRGVGVQLNPRSPLQFSAMYGRFQKAVPYDSLNKSIVAAYKRIGYGANLEFKKQKYAIGISLFHAKDDEKSLTNLPDSLAIRPKENIALSAHGNLRLDNGLELFAEYGTSALTEDVRATPADGKIFLKNFIPYKTSTSYFKAIKAQLNYKYKTSSIGIGYERIDPGYQTLGAYYFVNDIENVTINLAQSLLKEKAKLNVNVGFQRDDLDDTKSMTNKRVVSALTFNYTPSEKLSLDMSYSNFQSYMYIKPQVIEDIPPVQNVDTLNFIQISQNANANINYTLKNSKQTVQMLSLSLSFQDAADKQGGVIRSGNGSQFYNAMLSYTLGLVPKRMNISAAFNTNYNTIGTNNFMMLSPKLSVSNKFWNNQLLTNCSASYNMSTGYGAQQVNVLSIRAQAAYNLLKKHKIGLSINTQSKNINLGNTTDIITMLNYNYGF